ncbi:c-type cytochrome [Litorivicinus lipolyticus]|uniref:C-type cytochrome n=1 Tax=Litorivicinus lipolyticus TaxID=418701 RepID=A0A5Q2QD18_9GAMM|nr:c-type cytochrome [Litorivicinus lipolyticus]QGG81203.1 c-type cytochrome [Litorivicinus lipolyticus]
MTLLNSFARVACAAAVIATAPAFAETEAELLTYGSEQAYVQKCMACHGEDGISGTLQYPNIRGQKAMYIEAQLKAYRAGERLNKLMQSQAVALDDRTIKAIALYFSTR